MIDSNAKLRSIQMPFCRYWLGGIRHISSMNATQAFVRNEGTCRLDAKGAARSRDTANA